MSFESYTIAAMHSRAKGTQLLVLLGVANHDGDGGAWPSIRTLARFARCDERTVQRHLQALQALGEIRIDQQGGGLADMPDHRRPNRYHFMLTCPFDCDRTSQHRTAKQLRLDRVTPTSPGDTHVTPPGDTHVTPPGDTHVTRTSNRNLPSEPDNRRLGRYPQHARGAAVDNRPEHECDKGWLGFDAEERRVPCLICKPHLAVRR